MRVCVCVRFRACNRLTQTSIEITSNSFLCLFLFRVEHDRDAKIRGELSLKLTDNIILYCVGLNRLKGVLQCIISTNWLRDYSNDILREQKPLATRENISNSSQRTSGIKEDLSSALFRGVRAINEILFLFVH